MNSTLAIPLAIMTPFVIGQDIPQEYNRSQPPGERVVRFPKDRSLGRVGISDWNAPRWAVKTPKGQKLGPARGDVVIPAGKDLTLIFHDAQQDDKAPVDLSSLDQLRPTDLQALAIPFTVITANQVERLARHRSLRYLSLGPLSTVTDDCLAPLAKMTWLEVLQAPETAVSDTGLRHLRKLTNLKKLTLYGTAVTDRGMVHLSRLTQLKHLQLGFTDVTDGGLKHLAGLTNLEHLQLWKTRVDGTGLVHLRQMSKLKTLNLVDTQIGNADLVHLTSLTSLTRLDLSGTQVENVGLKHLTKLSNLETLLLARTRITETGVHELKQALPDCEISR